MPGRTQHTAHTGIPCPLSVSLAFLSNPLSLQGAPRPRHHRKRGPVLIRVGIVAAKGTSEPRDAAGEAALQLGERRHRDGKRLVRVGVGVRVRTRVRVRVRVRVRANLHRAQRRAVVERKGVLAHATEEDDAPARLGLGLGLGFGFGIGLGLGIGLGWGLGFGFGVGSVNP